jgi:hypothetical protein
MKVVAILLLVIAMCGCTSTREVYTQEGNIVYGIACRLQTYQGCIEEAGELCGTLGYKFVYADGTPAPPPTPPSATPSQPIQSTSRGNNFDAAPAPAAPAPVVPAAADAAKPADPSSQPIGFSLQRKYFVRCQS